MELELIEPHLPIQWMKVNGTYGSKFIHWKRGRTDRYVYNDWNQCRNMDPQCPWSQNTTHITYNFDAELEDVDQLKDLV